MAYVEVAVLVGIVGLFGWAAMYVYFRRRPERLHGKQGLLGLVLFGPFFPLLQGSLEQRGGRLSKREILGLAVMIGLFVAAVILSAFFGFGVRGR
jgi:drug/metabolite transporter (DMT)-like permease